MEQVGYSLVIAKGVEVKFFGDTRGICPGVPYPLVLPNGDAVHCAKVGDTYGDWQLVERWFDDDRPSIWHKEVSRTPAFDGEKVIVKVTYEVTPSLCPETITPRQARIALLKAGLLDQVKTAVAALGGEVEITWEYATEFKRDDAMIAQLAAHLGLDDAKLDDLFRLGASL